MSSRLITFGFFAASISQVLASCAYGTHLDPRAEEGKVKVNNFAYTGSNVSALFPSRSRTPQY